MAALKSCFSFILSTLAALSLMASFPGAAPVGAQETAPASGSSPAKESQGRAKQTKTRTSQAGATAHHHAVGQSAPPTRRRHGKSGQARVETAQDSSQLKQKKHHHALRATASNAEQSGTTTITDKHGRHLQIVQEVTVDRHGRRHKHYRQVAEETVVRDKHGHVIRRFFQGVAHGHNRPLRPEESTGSPKKEEEEVVAKESEEAPHEYGSYGKAYALYDEATNARLCGNYKSAIAALSRALDMVPANAHGGPSVLTLNMEFELAQAAESSGNLGLSARYFARAAADRPNFTEAFVHLANVLARNGQPVEALQAARQAVEHNPNDPRAHMILSVMLSRNGLSADARAEKSRAQNLLGSNTRIDPAPSEPASAVPLDAKQSLEVNDGQSANSSADASNDLDSKAGNSAADGVAPKQVRTPGNAATKPQANPPASSSSPGFAPEPGAAPLNN